MNGIVDTHQTDIVIWASWALAVLGVIQGSVIAFVIYAVTRAKRREKYARPEN
jgi:hypothetical protein